MQYSLNEVNFFRFLFVSRTLSLFQSFQTTFLTPLNCTHTYTHNGPSSSFWTIATFYCCCCSQIYRKCKTIKSKQFARIETCIVFFHLFCSNKKKTLCSPSIQFTNLSYSEVDAGKQYWEWKWALLNVFSTITFTYIYTQLTIAWRLKKKEYSLADAYTQNNSFLKREFLHLKVTMWIKCETKTIKKDDRCS